MTAYSTAVGPSSAFRMCCTLANIFFTTDPLSGVSTGSASADPTSSCFPRREELALNGNQRPSLAFPGLRLALESWPSLRQPGDPRAAWLGDDVPPGPGAAEVPHATANANNTRTALRVDELGKAVLEFPQSDVVDLQRQTQVVGDIAGLVGTYREQVTRELSILAREGLLSKQRRGLLIHDVARLKRLVDEVGAV